MCKNDITNQLLSIYRKIKNDENLVVDFDQDIGGELDSISFVTLVVEIENLFDIEFDDDDFELEKMSSINRISDIVQSYIKQS